MARSPSSFAMISAPVDGANALPLVVVDGESSANVHESAPNRIPKIILIINYQLLLSIINYKLLLLIINIKYYMNVDFF